jgi:hypothetical protein
MHIACGSHEPMADRPADAVAVNALLWFVGCCAVVVGYPSGRLRQVSGRQVNYSLSSRIGQAEEQIARWRRDGDAVGAVARVSCPAVIAPIGCGKIAVGLKGPDRHRRWPRNDDAAVGIENGEQRSWHGIDVKNCLRVPTVRMAGPRHVGVHGCTRTKPDVGEGPALDVVGEAIFRLPDHVDVQSSELGEVVAVSATFDRRRSSNHHGDVVETGGRRSPSRDGTPAVGLERDLPRSDSERRASCKVFVNVPIRLDGRRVNAEFDQVGRTDEQVGLVITVTPGPVRVGRWIPVACQIPALSHAGRRTECQRRSQQADLYQTLI